MSILYHLTILPPKMPECEAYSQEIHALREYFGGDLLYLNPNQFSPIYVPRILFGFHKLRLIRAREANHRVHHVYNPDPFPFPVFTAETGMLTAGFPSAPKMYPSNPARPA